ncbi:uncharacterized protein LOC111884930 isoform X2 [Lactuca sativa]|uniref:uncharacterized protein LOC111884930 isoform X2 n=1 Tax=Lactuca sativa TaxID=4236 RepID=UPI001C68894F|nr:uncharacterized protein LOC111884930 isoform X2 [Lactuca sativa]
MYLTRVLGTVCFENDYMSFVFFQVYGRRHALTKRLPTDGKNAQKNFRKKNKLGLISLVISIVQHKLNLTLSVFSRDSTNLKESNFPTSPVLPTHVLYAPPVPQPAPLCCSLSRRRPLLRSSMIRLVLHLYLELRLPTIFLKIIWAGICLCLHLGLVMIMFSVRVRSRYTTDMGVRLLSSDRDLFRAGFDVRRGMMPGGVDAGRDPKPDGAQWWWSKAQCTFGTNEKGPM